MTKRRNQPGTSKRKKNRERQAQRDPNLAKLLAQQEEEERILAQLKERSQGGSSKKSKSSSNAPSPKQMRTAYERSRQRSEFLKKFLVIAVIVALIGTLAIGGLSSLFG